jgi:PKD repeat protein
MKLKKLWVITMIVSSLFYIATFSVEAADVTISDGMGDVTSIDYLTGESNVVSGTVGDLTVDNLDLIQATYTKQGTQGTVSVQVTGIIEDRGKVIDPFSEDLSDAFNTVNYEFSLTTSEQDYLISYSNKTGTLQYADEQINLTSSDFSVVGNTLSITFTLTSADEVYENLSVSSLYLKADFSSDDISMVFLSDVAPNPPLTLYDASSETNIGFVGESIQFNASIEPLTGQPPYTYHWDFGDQSSSTQLSPTHSYTKAGDYTYTFTATDNAGATARQEGNITISGDGATEDSEPNQMILFLAILLIVIVIGVVIIVWIIRRR